MENLRLAANIIDSFTPEPTANFTPSGASVCTTNICDKSLHCLVHGDFSQYASEGPIYFYNNKDFLLTCQGFQPGVEHQCNVVAKETCGDTPDGGPPRFKDDADNCYGRATRNRPWNAGPNFTGSSGVTTSGNAKMIPAGAFIYKNDVFKNPGGKEFVVEALIIAIRCDPGVCQNTANLRVQLQNSVGVVIYDFGTITITASGSYSDYIFSSAIVVTAAGSQVRLINEGPREVTIQKVVARD